jgi:tetratricopeptide (TPR) repeat protein
VLAVMMRWLAILVVCFTVGVPRVVRADDPATRAAKRYFERGEKLFALGKFDEALDEYQKAFDAKAIPDFLFNIGQCYRNLGNLDQAIFSFKKYLRLEPDAANKDAVTKLIDELEDKQAHESGAKLIVQTPPPELPPREPERDPVYKRWWFWTSIGVVALAGGFGLYEVTRSSAPTTKLGTITFGQ